MLKQYQGNEIFTYAGKDEIFTVCDFWRWHCSRLMSNSTRGYLVEFIVAHALGIAEKGQLEEWASHDLIFQDKRIEIKASAYIQEWEQKINTNPRFSIKPARILVDGFKYAEQPRRNSDIYIFCIFAETDKMAPNPLCLDKWEFYPVLTSVLDATLGAQKSVGMATICGICPEPFHYPDLRDAVIRIFEKDGYI